MRPKVARSPGRRTVAACVLGLILAGGGSGCAGRAGAEGNGGVDTLTLGAYSVVREAFHEGLIPEFQARWQKQTGRTVRFEESYNASGAQSRAIAGGFDADIAVLSLKGDMDALVKAGKVRDGWDRGPRRGMATRSLVVIGVRDGNPHQIQDWADLARPGVGVLYPDPKTSGGARWNIAAVWGAGLLADGKDKPNPDAARDLLEKVQRNVVNMDSSGRQSLATFERGTGDAVVTYENELLLRQKFASKPIPYLTPPATLQIESPAALVETSIERHGNRAVAEAFLRFVESPAGQKILGEYGFRPIDDAPIPGQPPLPPRLFTINDLGGWSKVKKTVFDAGGVWDQTFTRRGGGTDPAANTAAKGSR